MRKCRFNHDDEVVVKVALSDGCMCYPEDKFQDLCYYHYMKSTPLGSMKIVKEYPAYKEWKRWLNS
jgi:hypothetical protein